MDQDELLIKALSDPHGLSDTCYPDGTPMTNAERYKEVKSRRGDFH